MLARLMRMDPKLLRPIRHRGEQVQMDLMRIKIRAALLDSRTSLVNAARGPTKAVGERLPRCGGAVYPRLFARCEEPQS